MCEICNGKTHEQVEEEARGFIRTTGWALGGVEASAEHHGWAYTIGLLDSYDHPELLIVDDDWTRAASILNVMGRAVRDGATFAPGDPIRFCACRAEAIPVHLAHCDSEVMAKWHNVRGPGSGMLPLDLEALQVIAHDPLPDGGVLPAVRLDDQDAVLARLEPGWPEGLGRS